MDNYQINNLLAGVDEIGRALHRISTQLEKLIETETKLLDILLLRDTMQYKITQEAQC